MLLPLPRAPASVELVGSCAASSFAVAVEHHAIAMEKQHRGSGWVELWSSEGEQEASDGRRRGAVEESTLARRPEKLRSRVMYPVKRSRRTQEDGGEMKNLGLG